MGFWRGTGGVALLSVKTGKRLSLGETLDLLLDESESVKQMEKAAAEHHSHPGSGTRGADLPRA
jgi:hypothetical protein